MPTTVNGIGTHYYGKKNKVTRTAVCRACGCSGKLDSYETRLWFVIFYIPIIPLGRKRINDDCQHCRRHFVSKAHDWEVARQAGTSAAIEKFRREPTEEAAFDVHAQLIGFHQFDQAKEFRDGVLSQFPDKALLRAKMAGHIEYSGRPDEAAPLWEEALALDPDLPEARVGVARQKMAKGELDEARKLLSFMEEPGAEQRYSLEPMMELAGYYQHSSRHAETLELTKTFLKAYPQSAKQHRMRKFVEKSERVLKRSESILPQRTGGLKGLFSSEASPGERWGWGILAVIVLAAIGMAINNEYTRRHRTLHVINATGVPANVQIDGQPAVPVEGLQTLQLSEGKHKLHVTGPLEEDHDVEVHSGYFDRWMKSPVWILNIGGEAIVADVTVHYAANPRPPDFKLSAEPFASRRHIDYPFGKEPPRSMEVKDKRMTVSKSTLSWYPVTGEDGIGAFLGFAHLDREPALKLAERKLSRNPDQTDLLSAYLTICNKDEDEARVQALLKSKIDYRPILVEWHRSYQALPTQQENFDALIAEYESLLKQDPKNASLLYLRGRVEEDPAAERKYLADAIAADPKSYWGYRAMAHAKMCEGDWQASHDNWELAFKNGLDRKGDRQNAQTVELALGKVAEVEASLRKEIEEEPRGVGPAMRLANVLACKNDGSDIAAPFNKAAQIYRESGPKEYMDVVDSMRAGVAYIGGNMKDCIDAAKTDTSASVRAAALLADGRPEEFAKDPLLKSVRDDPWLMLGCSIAYTIKGDNQAADEWREKAATHLAKKGGRIRKVSEVLREKSPSEQLLERVRLLTVEPDEKSLLLADLALRSNRARKKYIDEARKFQINHTPPYHLVKRALEKAEKMP